MKRFEKAKYFILGAIVMALVFNFIIPTFAAQLSKTITAVYNDIKISIDGKEVVPVDANGNAVEPFIADGTTYLPVRAIAGAVGYDVEWNGNTNTVILTKKQVDQPAQPPTADTSNNDKFGKISGNLTWQYNKMIGTKPDTGANALLIPQDFEKTEDMTYLNLILLTLSAFKDGRYGLYSAQADGYGKYFIDDVPIGDYYLLFVSENTTNNFEVDMRSEYTLKKLFGDSYEKIEPVLKLKKHTLYSVTIKEDKETIQSHDFGYTYY